MKAYVLNAQLQEEAVCDIKRGNPHESRVWRFAAGSLSFMSEQITGVEPAFSAWEADVLPIYDICLVLYEPYEISITDLVYNFK